MKKKISVVLLCGVILLGVCGCGNETSKEYYCDNEEHELRGTTCVIKTKQQAQFQYTCSKGETLVGSKCRSFSGITTSADKEYYCVQGILDGSWCIIESTYNAKTR